MAIYVIGDVQGCFEALQKLLSKINFNPVSDQLIFCGDVVNRGGRSLETLRWVCQNRDSCRVTLGNHDLSLLAQFYSKRETTKNIEFKEIFKAPDCEEMMGWLLQQELLIYLEEQNSVIVHAGIYPKWSLKRAKKEANFTVKKLRKKPKKFLQKMFGSRPNHYKKSTKGMDRARFAVNSFTRMRFLYKNSGINFKAKGETTRFTKLVPWFEYKKRKKIEPVIIFGHWSALGLYQANNVICLDTGKVWGGELTALKLPEQPLTQDNIDNVEIIQV